MEKLGPIQVATLGLKGVGLMKWRLAHLYSTLTSEPGSLIKFQRRG